ncbi:hypothetical protein J6590_078596 [Homalodisca vitripennis]|nr:hypothetical protein J6590_078596 [Homalodisca vitripennis]
MRGARPYRNEELEMTVHSLKSKKAPGPDGIPSETLKKLFHINPRLLLNMYNACLTNFSFSLENCEAKY